MNLLSKWQCLIALFLFSLPMAAQNEVLTPPAGLTQRDYVMTAVSYGEKAIRQNVKVMFDGQTAYLQGLSPTLPEAWVKAEIDDYSATFDTPQYLGTHTVGFDAVPQYLLGADTGTGDVSGLTMNYDPTTKAFSTTTSNWILLTRDPSQVSYIYDYLLNEVYILPEAIAGDDPLVTPPTGMTTKTCELRGYQYDEKHVANIPTHYTVEVGTVGDELYVRGLALACPEGWVRANVQDGVATVDAVQYLGNYNGLYDLYACTIDEVGDIKPLTFRYDAATSTLTMPDDDTFVINCGYETPMPFVYFTDVTIAPYSPQSPVMTTSEPPAGLDHLRYTLRARDYETDAEVEQYVEVCFDGDDVWMMGLSADFCDIWAKGQKTGNVVVFPKNQFLGLYGEEYPIWLGGVDIISGTPLYSDFILVYDPATGIFTEPEEMNYLIINASTTEVYHLELLLGVVISPVGSASIALPTQTDAAREAYDLWGRRFAREAAKQPGLYIQGGKKYLVK